MASRKDNSTPDQGRLKIRFFEFEVDGANSTLLEGIKSVAAAINRGSGAQTMRAVTQSNGNGAVPLGVGASEDEGEPEDTETIEYEAPAAPRRPAAPRKQATLKPVPGIDWNSPAPSIKDFISGLDLDSNMRKYTAIAYWFKEHRNTPAITIHHVYSAYKALGWTDFPKYAVGPLQDLKNKQEYKWLDGGAKGEYIINGYGEQEVLKWRKSNA